jgi:beta-glucanase (GH16 family)
LEEKIRQKYLRSEQMKIFLHFFLFLFLQNFCLTAQPSLHPEKWTLDNQKSDEFSGSQLDTSKWWKLNACAYTDSVRHGNIGGNGAVWLEENVYLQNGDVVFKVELNPDSENLTYPCERFNVYPFYSGGLLTHLTPQGINHGQRGTYTYGYYEIRAKLPGYYNAAHEPVGLGFFPTFWIAYQYAVAHCIIVHDEVDILEPSPEQYYDAKTNVFGWHDEAGNCFAQKTGEDSSRSSTPLFEDYHKFGLDLAPDHITFYFDDQPFFSKDTINYPSIAHSLDMEPYLAVEINIQMSGGAGRENLAEDAPFPQYMYVDYFRYFHPSASQTNVIFQNAPNPATEYTEIQYAIENDNAVYKIDLFTLQGRQLHSVTLSEKGIGKINVDVSSFAPGLYLYQLKRNEDIIGVKKLIVLQQ